MHMNLSHKIKRMARWLLFFLTINQYPSVPLDKKQNNENELPLWVALPVFVVSIILLILVIIGIIIWLVHHL